jgi:hypothetical protein
MRKLIVTAAATTGLILAAATATAQVLPPAAPLLAPPPAVSAPARAVSAPRPSARAAAPVGIAAHNTRLRNDPLLAELASDGSAEGLAVGAMRVLLRDRGFGPDVTAGPMTALAPGAELYDLLLSSDELDALVVPYQPQAWLIQTDAGRWWLWESGAAAPADMRAEVYQTHATRRAQAEGLVVD